MRTRIAVLFLTLGALIVPSTAAQAAPHHNRGLTIAATPNPIVAGDGVLIYGQLNGAANAKQPIYLWHRINPASRFTIISRTLTSSTGFYSFTRADGVVLSNRSWYVTGPDATHSRTIHERVAAQVTLGSSATNATTGEPITFSGLVYPAHVGQPVRLQEQDAITGSGWRTIATTRTGGSSGFSLVHAFRRPGTYTLRAEFGPDPRNIASASDQITLTVQQRQNPTFTINSSSPVITDGNSVTISGTLAQPGSTTTPEPKTPVTLYGASGGSGLKALAQTTTGADGSYSFTQSPIHNTVYVVMTAKHRHTARLFEGVADVVNATPSTTTTTTLGTPVVVTGTVTPDHTGHWIYLQEQTAKGGWADVAATRLTPGSHYTLATSFGRPGSFTLRVRIFGGPANVGGASAPFTVTVIGLPPAGPLPPAS